MNDTYRYSSLICSAEYKLTPESVNLTVKRFGRFFRSSVPYDKIPVHSSTITWCSKPLLWATAIVAICFVIALADLLFGEHPEPMAVVLYAVAVTVVGAIYFATRTSSEVFMFGDEHLSLFRRAGEDEDWGRFLQALQSRKLDCFKQTITRRAKQVRSEEIVPYLLYLRETNLVDEAGYDELRATLEKLDASQSSIGFHTAPTDDFRK